jgi:hypothetical protein
MLRLRTDPQGADPELRDRYAYPSCMSINCFLMNFWYDIGKLRTVIGPDDDVEIENRREPIFLEIGRGLGGNYQDYLYPQQVGPKAMVEGLVLMSYRVASDLIDPPLTSVFVQGSRQMEGSGLRFAQVRAVWPPTGLEEELLLAHGGAYADQTFDQSVWLGLADEDQSIVTWLERPAGTTAPLGRADSVLVRSLGAQDALMLFGGRSASGLLNDFWKYSANNDEWTQITPAGEIPTPRSGVGFAQRGDGTEVYLFGGMTTQGSSNDLFLMDLESNTFIRLWPIQGGSYGPSARWGASVTLDETHERILVYGGRDSWGPTNDLWAFDLVEGTWEMLFYYCQYDCPPLSEDAVAFYDRWSDRVRVLPGYTSQYYWGLNWSFSQAEGWTSPSPYGGQ